MFTLWYIYSWYCYHWLEVCGLQCSAKKKNIFKTLATVKGEYLGTLQVKISYLTISMANDTIFPCDNLTTLLKSSPLCPKSKTSMQPFSDSVYKVCRELSTSILTIGSSSYNAAFRNDGTRNERAFVEWFTFLQCFPNQPNWACKTKG